MVDPLAFEPDLAAGLLERRFQKADDRGRGDRLAGTRFADHAQHFAGRDREADIVDRGQRPGPGRQRDAEMRNLEQSPRHRSLGFNASRTQSPNKFTDRISAASVIAGKTVIHHSPENRNELPTRINVPSDGSVGGRPTPRKDKVASVMIALAR